MYRGGQGTTQNLLFGAGCGGGGDGAVIGDSVDLCAHDESRVARVSLIAFKCRRESIRNPYTCSRERASSFPQFQLLFVSRLVLVLRNINIRIIIRVCVCLYGWILLTFSPLIFVHPRLTRVDGLFRLWFYKICHIRVDGQTDTIDTSLHTRHYFRSIERNGKWIIGFSTSLYCAVVWHPKPRPNVIFQRMIVFQPNKVHKFPIIMFSDLSFWFLEHAKSIVVFIVFTVYKNSINIGLVLEWLKFLIIIIIINFFFFTVYNKNN